MERRYTVMKPVYQTVNQQRRYTVMKPVYQTTMVEQPYTVCRPVTTVRQVVEECGYYETQMVTVPGPVVERQVRIPVDPCDSCERPARSCSAASTRRRRYATVAVQCPPRNVCQTRLRLAPGRPQRLRDALRHRDDDAPGPGPDLHHGRRGAGRELSR